MDSLSIHKEYSVKNILMRDQTLDMVVTPASKYHQITVSARNKSDLEKCFNQAKNKARGKRGLRGQSINQVNHIVKSIETTPYDK